MEVPWKVRQVKLNHRSVGGIGDCEAAIGIKIAPQARARVDTSQAVLQALARNPHGVAQGCPPVVIEVALHIHLVASTPRRWWW